MGTIVSIIARLAATNTNTNTNTVHSTVSSHPPSLVAVVCLLPFFPKPHPGVAV